MTEEMTIEQQNEMISHFMGLSYGNGGHGYPDGTGWCNYANLKYHSSWDWLMPVVKKIKAMHFDILQRAEIFSYMNAAAPMNSALISVDLEKLHAGVYQFVKWHTAYISSPELK